MRRLSLSADSIARARNLRRNMTDAKRVLWRGLRQALPDYHWRKQVPIGPYIADFCAHAPRLIIEVDGGQHALESERDAARTGLLESEAYCVLRFWNDEVTSNLGGVIETIADARRPPRVEECN